MLLSIVYNLSSQNKTITKVTYTTTLDLDINVSNKSELIFNNIKSYYIEGEYNRKSNETLLNLDSNNNIFHKIYYYNLLNDSIYTKDKLENKIVLVSEKAIKIPWIIDYSQEIEILGFKCNKAEGTFRGRVYTVWFTNDIPVKFGPWKLQGLPGLILEVKDNMKQVEFKAEKIEYKIEKLNLIPKNNNYQKLNLKEYVTKIQDDIKSEVQRIISKLPRNSKVKNLNYKKYKGLELEYEWDKI
jgi:GLPGLI family protein